MNVVFCGGGTIGHINPAIALAEEFKKNQSESKITFIVRRGGSENDVLKKRNESICEINICGLKRKFTLDNFKCIKNAFNAIKESKTILEGIAPDCVIGTGGYVCWPVIKAASSLNIPTFIHESNIYPGLVTKLLSSECDKVFLCAEETKKFLWKRGNYCVTGNPLLTAYAKTSRNDARTRLHLKKNDRLIVSFGGSIGAEKINDTVLEVMRSYSQKAENIHHIHATGKRLYEETVKKWKTTSSDRCTIVPYIENMPLLLRAADLVICRAGAMTLSEISAVGAPSVVIPSPHVANNHQYKNAKILNDKGAIVLLEEKNLTPASLLEKIDLVLSNDELRNSMSKRIKPLHKTDSSKIIYQEITESLK